MKTYIVNLHTKQAYEYPVKAYSEKEAIEKAKEIYANQNIAATISHLYDFAWLECEAIQEKEQSK